MSEIVFHHASKIYEEEEGLFDFSVQIAEGESFGLLGPTGAGKTTALSLLMGFIKADEGEVSIRGWDCFSRRHEIVGRVGYLPKDASLPKRTTGEEFIALMSRARAVVGKSRMQELMERLDVNPLGDYMFMSLQDRRKVLLVMALMHGPEILLLDDPCAGLDPNAQIAVFDLINEQRTKGKTIVMASHVFEQVQRCCDRAAIIRKGRLIAIQSSESLSVTRQKVYYITFTSMQQASAFAQEWDSGVELIRNRAIVAIPSSPQALINILSKYSVLDLVGGREESEDNLLRSFGGDLL